MKKTILLTALLLISIITYSQSITIDIDSTYLTVGEWTTFTVTASGEFDNIKYTEPKDLNMTQIGKSTFYTNVQGKRTRSYSLKYRIQALKDGNLKLPVFYTEDKNGNRVSSEDITIYVTKLEESLITEHNVNSQFETNYVKLFLEIPDRNLYVGEAIPVKVVAYFSTLYQPGIEREPYIKTGSFILDSSEKYNNNLPEVVIDGQKWIQISWDSFLTPLKSGDLEIEVAMESYIDKPSTNPGFFASSEREQIKTSSELKVLNIKPLPLENRPESFTGAIGVFSLNSSLDFTEINVGDPITLTMDLFGNGNFQRVSVPKIGEDSEKWKLYPESFTFSGSNNSNYKGVKSFQQIMSPKNIDIDQLPKFYFSFFDPVKEEYVQLTTEPYALKINPGEFQDKIIDEVTDSRFVETKETMRHLKSHNNRNYNNIVEKPILYILGILSLILIISSLVLKILLSIKDNPNKNNRQKELISLIKSFEIDKDYNNALAIYKELISYIVSKNSGLKESAVTSFDLDSTKFRVLFKTVEDLPYTNEVIDKDRYEKLISGVLEELKC